ncbi:MAG: hypothetical protein ACYDER_06965 [Ktedonobacteraceae bacterium]
MTTFRPDLLIENSDGDPIAVVEVKAMSNLTRDEATVIRRNMLARGLPAHVPYFLLLSQDVGYLWKESKQYGVSETPMYEFPMHAVVNRYLDKEAQERLYGSVLELVMLQWLYNLSTKPQVITEEPEKTLARSGFNESIKGAMVLMEGTL